MSKREFTPEEIAKSLRVCAKPNHCEGCDARGHGFQYCDLLFDQAADLIEAQAKRIGELDAELAKLREENRWIPVTERLPDLDDGVVLIEGEMAAVQVLAVIEGAKKSTCLYFDGEDFFDIQGDELIPYRVNRWRPMPKGSEG